MSLVEDASLQLVHLLARAALRWQAPLQAQRTVGRVTRHLRPYSAGDALLAHRKLRGQGTCLSRAFAVAARLPGAEVVIGVNPRLGPPLRAHAWVEHSEGQARIRLDDQPAFVEEIARFGA